MEVPILQIDAFASGPFKGNPAAVCLLSEAKSAEWMQNVAAEMNLSETAYVVPRNDGGFDLRWFTPAIEVPLCGHATLASAHALWETGLLDVDREARFHTLSGRLGARKTPDGIELDFPVIFNEPVDMPVSLADALGLDAGKINCVRGINKANGNYLVEFDAEDAVRNLKPNFEIMRRAIDTGIIVTARGEASGFDFISRFFASYAGIDEDPVTGSAHCMLAPYWSAKLGKTEMRAYQASSRGGEVRVRLNGDRVILVGRAVTVLKGRLLC